MYQFDIEDFGPVALPGESGLVFPVNDKGERAHCIEVWCGDSASSRHVTYSKDALYYTALTESVLWTVGGKELLVLGRGSLDLKVMSSDRPKTTTLRDVL